MWDDHFYLEAAQGAPWRSPLCEALSLPQGPPSKLGLIGTAQSASAAKICENISLLLHSKYRENLENIKLRPGMASFSTWKSTGMFILWFGNRLFNTCYLVGTILGTQDTCLPLYKSNQGALLQLKIQILSLPCLKLFILTTLRITPQFRTFLLPTLLTW